MAGSLRLRIAGVATMALVVAGSLTACGGDSGSGSSTKSNGDLLKDAVANMKAAKTYHMDADLTSSGQPVKMTGDIDQSANKFKLSMSAAGQSVDVIQVGSDVYLSMDGGKTYTKSDSSTSAGFSGLTNMWENVKPEDIDKSKDSIKDGNPATEKIDGTDTKHMTANAADLGSLTSGTSAGGTTQDGTVDFWVTTDAKPIIRQMKITSTDTNGTLKWSNIDAPVEISAPQTNHGMDHLLAMLQPLITVSR